MGVKDYLYIPGFIGLAFYVCTSSIIFRLTLHVQPTPYIDELFHIPQAIKYCNLTFSEWDPKITTLPGLYLISMIIYTINGIPCTVFTLRLLNVIISVANFRLIYLLFVEQCRSSKVRRRKINVTWNALNLSFCPVMFFFSFFYYTETFSTFFVLLAYLFSRRQQYFKSSFFGFLSVLIRQTNIIWVVFLLLYRVSLLKDDFPRLQKVFMDYLREISISQNGEKLTLAMLVLKRLLAPMKPPPWFARPHSTFTSALSRYHMEKKCEKLSSSIAGYVTVCTLFAAFIFWNQGIVVGDRSAHKPVMHLCQLFYFTLFVLIFKGSYWLDMDSFISLIKRKINAAIAIGILIAIIVNFNTMAHPYLLADNRHYTFYLWKRLYENLPFGRYIVIPIYMFGFYCIDKTLDEAHWKLPYYFALSCLLVPQKLLDFRYFILPFVFLRLQLIRESVFHLFVESMTLFLINAGVFYIYATKVFHWDDSPEPQRLGW